MSEGYVPGVCNIGPAETRRRRTIGVAGVVAAGGTVALCLATGAPRGVRAVVALPATMAASGFLQAAAHFCSGFGMRGLLNLGALGEESAVESDEDRETDRRRALGLLGASAGIGASAAVLALALP